MGRGSLGKGLLLESAQQRQGSGNQKIALLVWEHCSIQAAEVLRCHCSNIRLEHGTV